MNEQEKITGLEELYIASFQRELEEWNKLDPETEEKTNDILTRQKDKVTINKPEQIFPDSQGKTAFTTEGIWQELRDIKLLLLSKSK